MKQLCMPACAISSNHIFTHVCMSAVCSSPAASPPRRPPSHRDAALYCHSKLTARSQQQQPAAPSFLSTKSCQKQRKCVLSSLITPPDIWIGVAARQNRHRVCAMNARVPLGPLVAAPPPQKTNYIPVISMKINSAGAAMVDQQQCWGESMTSRMRVMR